VNTAWQQDNEQDQAGRLARAREPSAGPPGRVEETVHRAAEAGPGVTHADARQADAETRRADERAQAARSVGCPCQAGPGAPCSPSGDHLARYLRAELSGAIARESLKEVIAGLDVIAPRVLIQPPGERADYHPATDTIRLPLRAQFRSAEGYYATAFHEAGHSTGHPDRLNRPGIAAFDHFGSGKYAREELIAQMSSSLLCAQTGIEDPETFENSASYIAGWLSALNHDTRLVVTAAAQAQRACDLINQAEREPARDGERQPESALTGDEHVATETTAAAADSHQASLGPGGYTSATKEHGSLAGHAHEPAVPERQPPAPAAGRALGVGARIAPGHTDGQDGSLEVPLRPGGTWPATPPARAITQTSDWQAEAG
jgi:Zincin-like metallopeptidase